MARRLLCVGSMSIAFEHEVSGYGDGGSTTTERGGAPGKRMLTDRLQRKASGTLPAPSVSSSPVQRVEDNGLSCEQSFLDSILIGPVQRRTDGEAAGTDVHALAAHGTSGSGGALPFLDRIQSSFGAHDVSHVQAHTDGAASDAARGMGAHAFATGDHVAFAGTPDLHTAAHEAAHVVQQRAGVHLKGGVGEVGDVYEQHADAVADAVVRGESAEELLTAYVAPCGGAGSTSHVQQQAGAVQRAPGKDTGGGGEAGNLRTRTFGSPTFAKGDKLTIAAGSAHGVRPGMACRLVSKQGVTLDNVTIADVDDTISHAIAQTTPGEGQEVDHVIVNPTEVPRAQDLNTRIIGISVVNNGIQLAIGAGSAHGVRPWMDVHLISKSGRKFGEVTIGEVRETTSFARWTGTEETLRQEEDRVIVNPSA